MNRIDKVEVGNEISCVYFLTDHQASIIKGRVHEINLEVDCPYIMVMAIDSSTHRIDMEDIRTLQKK